MSAPPPLTDAEIIRVATATAKTSTSGIPQALLSETSHTTLISHLHTLTSSQSISDYTQSLLSLISLSPHTLSPLLSSLLLAYSRLFTARQIPHDSNSLRTVHFFDIHLDYVPVDELSRVVDEIVEGLGQVSVLDDAQLLELLPKCLRLMNGGGEVVERLLERDWSNGVLLKMVEIGREVAVLRRFKGREFLRKVFDGIMGLDLQDVPGVVYQLLVLGSKGFGKREVVEGIVMLFGGNEMGGRGRGRGRGVVGQVEGTVLLHFNFAVKQDPSLGLEVVGVLKSGFRAFNHFAVAVLLSVARVRRFSESSLGVLKTRLVNAYRDYRFAKVCEWLSDGWKKNCLQNIRIAEDAILRAVDESSLGREHLIPSIMQFGFMLLESVDDGANKDLCNSDGVLGIEQLSIQILRKLFEVHDMARNEIIDQCKFRILSLKSKQSILVIRLLGNLIKGYPYLLLEHVSRLKELLDYFTFMDGKVATCLVTALLPLIRYSRNLQDYTILVVQKAMFRREESVRLAATSSIVNIILADKKSKGDVLYSFQESSSQASCSQQAEIPCSMRGSLFQELCGLLQRCLYQQAKVKEILYHGLLKLVLSDPSSSRAVFDFLLPHFLHYFREDSVEFLEIGSCIKSENGRTYIEEPLDCLLFCVSWILFLQPYVKVGQATDSLGPCFGFSLSQDNEAERNCPGEFFSNALLKTRKSLRNKTLEGILGQTHNAGSIVEEKNKCSALVLSGIIEVLLNTISSELERAADEKKDDLERELMDFIDLLVSLEKDASTLRQNNGVKRGNLCTSTCDIYDNKDIGDSRLDQKRNLLLATSSFKQLLEIAVKIIVNCATNAISSQTNSQRSSSKTGKDFKFISFVLNGLLCHMKAFALVGKDDPLKTLIYGDIRMLGTPLLKLIYVLKKGSKYAADQKKKEINGKKDSEGQKEYIHLAIVSLKELIVITLGNPQMISLLEDLISVSSVEYPGLDNECEEFYAIEEKQIRLIQLFIVKTLKPLFCDLLKLSLFREVEVLCDIILMVGNILPSKWKMCNGEWALCVCQSNAIRSSKVAKCMVTLAVCLSSPPVDLSVAQDMAAELLKVTESESGFSERSETYALINRSTCTSISSCILQLIETVITDMDWAVKKLKAICDVTQKSAGINLNDELASVLVFEGNLYSRAEAVVKVLSSFVLMSLKDSQEEHLLRLATRFYKILAQMAKTRIAPKGFKQILPSPEFQSLVENTCRKLTVPLYIFMSEMQKKQHGNPQNKAIINKIKRENKCIPELIFQVEDYEKYLIQLGKISKVNLLRHAKRSTARDFKILDPDQINREDNVPNIETNHNVPSEATNESSEGSDDNEGDESEQDLPVKSGSPPAVEDSCSDAEGEDILPDAKRSRISNIVQDSDDE